MARAITKKEATVATERSDRRTRTGDQWLDTFFPYRLYRASEKLQLRLHARLRALRMSSSQWRVISVLKAYGALSIGEIVEATLMEQPTISRVVARLEKNDLVARRPSTRDSRMTLISLTTAGAEMFKQIVPAALRHQDLALEGIPRKDIAQLIATLERIEQNIEGGD
jgi:MarR family transcriptional regulator, organic hydroperoxide resistance regulator